jgi:dTDP-4-amino-4,6-dideoxygalactose transaminase
LAKAIGFCLAKNKVLSSWLFSKGRSSSDHSETAYLTDSSYHRGLYEWQAYVLLKQFENIETILMERRIMYKRYDNGISNDAVKCKPVDYNGVCIRFPILVSDRKRFVEHCRANHISVGTGYNRLYCSEKYHTAHEISREIVYLPFGNGYTQEEINKVISVVNSFK